jgi:hypothetical protein
MTLVEITDKEVRSVASSLLHGLDMTLPLFFAPRREILVPSILDRFACGSSPLAQIA